MEKIVILIPCYNEEKTIGKVIADFHKVMPEAVVYVYDNNSTDATAECALNAGAIVRREFQQGKGNVIRRMFREIDSDCYILTDGDDTYPAESAKKMAQLVFEKNADMVIGDRLSSTYFHQNRRRFHGIGNILVKKSINLLFKSNIKDIMTGYRAFSWQFVKTFPILSRGFEIETEMTIHAIDKKMSIENVVIDYRERPQGSSSKLNTFSDGLRVVITIIRLFRVYKPFSFFFIIAILLALVSLSFFIPVFMEFLKTHTVAKFPTLIVCGFVMLAALHSFFAGLILQTIAQKNRQDFEMNLIALHNSTNKKKEYSNAK